jgi:copper(I)-binding protein
MEDATVEDTAVDTHRASTSAPKTRSTRSSRLSRRTAVFTAALAGCAGLLLTGCSAGQVTQTSSQASAVNGNSAEIGLISLRNVHVVYPNDEEFTNSAGGNALLSFVIINNSPATEDRLREVSSDAAEVRFEPESARELPPSRVLVAVAPGTEENADAMLADPNTRTATVELTNLKENLTPGLTFPMTFDFENAGGVTLQVPIDAGPDVEREASEGGGH